MAAITQFKRGQSFSFLMKMPDTVEDGFFRSWQPHAQLRRKGNSSKDGFIADLSCFWADKNTTRYLTIHHDLTDKWPVGEAELDVEFVSTSGARLRSKTVTLLIIRGITA